MNRVNFRVIVAFSALGVIATAGMLVAGPLDPPAGPITPTYKTLSEVEPRIAVSAANTPGDGTCVFKITNPGSYYLTENISGAGAKHGVLINASGVTLDLNGFDLNGPGDTGKSGVAAGLANLTRITVINGSVRNWTFGAAFQSSIGCRVERLRAHANNTGIGVGTAAVVIDCIASNNQVGIDIADGGTVRGCTAKSNAYTGINAPGATTISACYLVQNLSGVYAAAGSTLTQCAASQNSGYGFLLVASAAADCSSTGNSAQGFVASDGSTLTNCSASSNGQHGFEGSGATFSACSAISNTQSGFSVSDHCSLTGCSAVSNGERGIVTGNSSSVIDCLANNNALNGITTGTHCTVADCTARVNSTGSGITVSTGSTVSGCTSGGNAGDGIVASSNCQVRANTCQGNGVGAGVGAGVNCTGILNRVEDNICASNDYGIFVAGTRNFLVRNTCGGNSVNWNVVSGNYALVVNPSTSPAISGNSGGSSVGTDPNANFSY